jgi:hypothetical protein
MQLTSVKHNLHTSYPEHHNLNFMCKYFNNNIEIMINLLMYCVLMVLRCASVASLVQTVVSVLCHIAN